MNVHHLELFYYVAKYGGITPAVRHIPYGIGQPAVSGQMRALEENAGAVLFERKQFRLTPAGEKLFAHVAPFFENLDRVGEAMRDGAEPELRLGASELVLRDHIPAVMQEVRRRHPRMRLSLRSGHQNQLETWLRDDQIDVAVGPREARTPAGLRSLALAHVPLVLMVPKRAKVKDAETFFRRKKITEPLVGLPASSSIMRNFQAGLKQRNVVWPQTVEVASIELIARYVANGAGCGVNVAIPSVMKERGVAVLPLGGFTPMTMGVLWRGEPSAHIRTVIDEVKRYSHQTWPTWASAEAD